MDKTLASFDFTLNHGEMFDQIMTNLEVLMKKLDSFSYIIEIDSHRKLLESTDVIIEPKNIRPSSKIIKRIINKKPKKITEIKTFTLQKSEHQPSFDFDSISNEDLINNNYTTPVKYFDDITEHLIKSTTTILNENNESSDEDSTKIYEVYIELENEPVKDEKPKARLHDEIVEVYDEFEEESQDSPNDHLVKLVNDNTETSSIHESEEFMETIVVDESNEELSSMENEQPSAIKKLKTKRTNMNQSAEEILEVFIDSTKSSNEFDSINNGKNELDEKIEHFEKTEMPTETIINGIIDDNVKQDVTIINHENISITKVHIRDEITEQTTSGDKIDEIITDPSTSNLKKMKKFKSNNYNNSNNVLSQAPGINFVVSNETIPIDKYLPPTQSLSFDIINENNKLFDNNGSLEETDDIVERCNNIEPEIDEALSKDDLKNSEPINFESTKSISINENNVDIPLSNSLRNILHNNNEIVDDIDNSSEILANTFETTKITGKTSKKKSKKKKSKQGSSSSLNRIEKTYENPSPVTLDSIEQKILSVIDEDIGFDNIPMLQSENFKPSSIQHTTTVDSFIDTENISPSIFKLPSSISDDWLDYLHTADGTANVSNYNNEHINEDTVMKTIQAKIITSNLSDVLNIVSNDDLEDEETNKIIVMDESMLITDDYDHSPLSIDSNESISENQDEDDSALIDLESRIDAITKQIEYIIMQITVLLEDSSFNNQQLKIQQFEDLIQSRINQQSSKSTKSTYCKKEDDETRGVKLDLTDEQPKTVKNMNLKYKNQTEQPSVSLNDWIDYLTPATSIPRPTNDFNELINWNEIENVHCDLETNSKNDVHFDSNLTSIKIISQNSKRKQTFSAALMIGWIIYRLKT
nr:uncharacterized protein LOC124496124 [Dermatophagoides farinae]